MTTMVPPKSAQVPYPAYQSSGFAWLGVLPASWTTIKLKHSTYLKARVGWHGLNADEFSDTGVHLVTGTDFNAGAVNWSTCRRVSEDRYEQDPYIQLQEDDLLVTKDGTIGKLARVVGLPERATLNSGVFLVRPYHDTYRSAYLQRVLESKVFNDFVLLRSGGTTINHLYQRDFGEFTFPRPSLAEQDAIILYLDRTTEHLDSLCEKQTRMLKLLTEKRLAVITQAVTRGIAPSAAVKPSDVAWVGDVPSHWAVEPIGARYEVQLGKMLDQKQATGDVGRPYLRNTNVQWGRIDTHDLLTMEFDEAERRKFALRPGDLLVCEGGDVGRAALWDGQLDECYYQKALHRLRPFREGDSPRFLYYLMFAASKLGVFLADGNKSTIIHLTAVKLRRSRMPFPPPAEQDIIVDFLDCELGKLDQLAAKIRQQLELVREHRAALITAAVTGQIDVRAQAQP